MTGDMIVPPMEPMLLIVKVGLDKSFSDREFVIACNIKENKKKENLKNKKKKSKAKNEYYNSYVYVYMSFYFKFSHSKTQIKSNILLY